MTNYIISTNPAKNYEEVGRIEVTNEDELKAIIDKAHEAFPAWRALGVEGRLPYFEKLVSLFKEHTDEIAKLQTTEMGRPIGGSRWEANNIADWLTHKIAVAPEMLAPEVTDSYDNHQVEVHREPYGVVAAIAPWNYPSIQFALATLQQLIAGNTVVFKHSEECILTSKLFADIIAKAELPEGVFTSIYGDGTLGAQLAQSNVQLIHFTGSTKVGKELYKVAAEKFIPAVLEMGGSSPGIILEDADLESTCLSAFNERNDNTGQVCSALKRLFVHESVYDEVLERLTTIAKEQRVGDPMDADTTMGPLVAERQLIQIERQVQDALDKGATLICGGKRPEGLEGAYYEPTILTDVTNEMVVMNEEVFGPVLPVVKFSDEDEVIRLANNTEYGLSAFVYTADMEKAERVAHQLEAGQVSINGKLFFADNAPFGGYKMSGIGRSDGKLSYHYVTQIKVISKPNI